MSVLAHFFESFGLSTVLVGFVKEHIESIKPPRALWLDFPMGRPLGKPNDPDYLQLGKALFLDLRNIHLMILPGINHQKKKKEEYQLSLLQPLRIEETNLFHG